MTKDQNDKRRSTDKKLQQCSNFNDKNHPDIRLLMSFQILGGQLSLSGMSAKCVRRNNKEEKIRSEENGSWEVEIDTKGQLLDFAALPPICR